MKKTIFILIATLVLFTALVWPRYTDAGKAQAIDEALTATGVTVQEIVVSAWSKLPDGLMDDEQMDAVVRSAMRKLGIKEEEYCVKHMRTGMYSTVRAEALSDCFRVIVAIKVLRAVPEKPDKELYMTINVDTHLRNKGILAWQREVNAIFESLRGISHVSTCLVGYVDGKLERNEMDDRLQRGFAAIDASILDSCKYANFVSYTGFSPVLNDVVQVGKDNINVNMVMRYSSCDDRTYVMVGSPVIVRDY